MRFENLIGHCGIYNASAILQFAELTIYTAAGPLERDKLVLKGALRTMERKTSKVNAMAKVLNVIVSRQLESYR